MITRKDRINALNLSELFSEFGKDNLMKNGWTHRHVENSEESSDGCGTGSLFLEKPDHPGKGEMGIIAPYKSLGGN